MNVNRRMVGRALDVVYVLLLVLYAIAGYRDVPFHGDESTLIYMSGDYYHFVQRRDPEPLYYDSTPADPLDQHLRIVNGTVGKLAMGFGWDLAGFRYEDLNRPWLWGAGWEWNVTDGHMPEDRLLYAARLSSAVLLALSVLAVFGIGWLVGGGWIAAWAAALIYVTHPAVLLDGRRAMMEGSHLGFATLAVLVGLLLIHETGRSMARSVPRRWRENATLTALAAAFGIAGGLAVASKHTALMTLAALFGAAAVIPLIPWIPLARRNKKSDSHRPPVGTPFPTELERGNLARLVGAGILTLLVFFVLNPAWWSDPLHMPGRVLEQRRALLDGQVAGYGGYDGIGERLEGLVDFAFFADTQFYEAPGWSDPLRDQIAQYRATWWDGRGTGPIWGVALLALALVGLWDAVRRWREGVVLAALVWLGFTAVVLVIVTPLAWQRYYLPLVPPLAVFAGAGARWVVNKASPLR
ncbi:MAG: phospholipid carrier-dependent glycosyltransferase [Anaerolineae bacterium]|nr:phospholipid carrier-dependent glycosyltransferase [Anaerolineae bacterium]